MLAGCDKPEKPQSFAQQGVAVFLFSAALPFGRYLVIVSGKRSGKRTKEILIDWNILLAVFWKCEKKEKKRSGGAGGQLRT